jgi:hypothetical protein
MPRYRHIVRIANRQLWMRLLRQPHDRSGGATGPGVRPSSGAAATPRRKIFTLPANAALHQEIYATIPNYLLWELRYMDAGEQGPKAPKLGHRGRRVTNSHVIHYHFGHRDARTAIDGTDL